MNDETIELLLPYLELRMSGGAAAKEKDAAEDGTLPAFHPKFAGGACSQAVTLMQYAEAMKGYHEASKVVKPKLEALKLAEARLAEAQRKQKVAETQLAECEATLQELEDDLGRTMSEKKALEDQARAGSFPRQALARPSPVRLADARARAPRQIARIDALTWEEELEVAVLRDARVEGSRKKRRASMSLYVFHLCI